MKGLFCVGALGRMGRATYEAVSEDERWRWVGGLDQDTDPSRGVVTAFGAVPAEVDVILDYSLPGALELWLPAAIEAGLPAVVGTTGFSDDDLRRLNEASAHIPVLLSPNMSRGVNVMFRLARELVGLMPGYDVELIELHHNQQRDAPSGTATRLLDVLASERELTVATPGREGDLGPRRPEEIGVHAVRAGQIVGEHRLIFAGNHESIELVHRAVSRQTLARGGLDAAAWLIGKEPGRYSMDDFLYGLQK